MPTNQPGQAPYLTDATRKWVETYRVGGKIKPALIVKAATDSNYINDQLLQLPAYGNNWASGKSICNVITPGQRIPGILSWDVTESLENIIQTAQLTALDALPQSRISTTITGFGTGTKGANNFKSVGSMPAQWHSTRIRFNWVSDGKGVSTKLTGDKQVSSFVDPTLGGASAGSSGNHFLESNLLYRIFEPEVIVGDFSSFPDPSVQPPEAEGINEWWDISASGVGAYYILIDQEVMRVTRLERLGGGNDRLYIIPGGRGVAGYIGVHTVGETVQLLGFPPFNGLWAAFGYLMPKDYKANMSPFRPGTCFVTYEGYGNPGDYTHPNGTGPFSAKAATNPWCAKQFDRNNNMCFTGFWFSESPQVTLDNTGVPQIVLTLNSAGHVVTEQKIDPNNIARAKSTIYSWATATFDQVGYNRQLPGDWFDFNMWDPSRPGSYPLTISTEYAQDQAFFNHMNDTNFGQTCQYCQQEWLDFIKQHEHGKPTGSIAEARAVGKHIYQESIRVFNKGGQFNAGPLKTFGRLMFAMAIAAWENPLQGNELGTRWTKMPDQLFDNISNWTNGRVWNGQHAYNAGEPLTYDWSNDTPEDKAVYGARLPLKSPFTTQYDRQPWSQPMLDLADLNRMTFTISREGFPIFAPIGKKLRGLPNPSIPGSQTEAGQFVDSYGNNTADNDVRLGEWILRYGGSIDTYTHTIDPTTVLTLVYVSCQTAFGEEIQFTIPAAGTGIKVSNNKNNTSSESVIMYSNQVGNKEGLQLTSGVHQVDEVSLDNLLLGLDWNTDPASWGLTVKRGSDNLTQVDSQPPMPNPGTLALYFDSADSKKAKGKKVVTGIQQIIMFLEQRRYMGPSVFDDLGHIVYGFSTSVDGAGKFGKATDAGVKNMQNFLDQQGNVPFSFSGGYYKFTKNGTTWHDQKGAYGIATWKAITTWMSVNSEYIKTDVWWYVQNGLPWEQYIGAITGMPIPQRRDDTNPQLYVIDQQALKTEADQWMKRFFKDAINYGNAVVDDSINKATQKVVTSNMADPRIQLGDVIWAEVPGYLTAKNAFNQTTSPFLNGIYITGISRSLDLREGSYTATYSGYRYRGNFESVTTQNAANYCSKKTQV